MAQPTFIEPMLATRVAALPEGSDWEYEVKWDGYRIEAVKDGKTSMDLAAAASTGRNSRSNRNRTTFRKAVPNTGASRRQLDPRFPYPEGL